MKFWLLPLLFFPFFAHSQAKQPAFTQGIRFEIPTGNPQAETAVVESTWLTTDLEGFENIQIDLKKFGMNTKVQVIEDERNPFLAQNLEKSLNQKYSKIEIVSAPKSILDSQNIIEKKLSTRFKNYLESSVTLHDIVVVITTITIRGLVTATTLSVSQSFSPAFITTAVALQTMYDLGLSIGFPYLEKNFLNKKIFGQKR